jgi:hypothetical protein
MRAGDLVWFCWWKGYTSPYVSGTPDLIRKAAVIVEEYITLDNDDEVWYDIYIFEDTRRLLVDTSKIELMKVRKEVQDEDEV